MKRFAWAWSATGNPQPQIWHDGDVPTSIRLVGSPRVLLQREEGMAIETLALLYPAPKQEDA